MKSCSKRRAKGKAIVLLNATELLSHERRSDEERIQFPQVHRQAVTDRCAARLRSRRGSSMERLSHVLSLPRE